MHEVQPDPYHWYKPRQIQVFIGINIYHDAMRRYIGETMRGKAKKTKDNWFANRVINIIAEEERRKKLQRRFDSYAIEPGHEEGLIEVRDIPEIISAQKNKDVFPVELRQRWKQMDKLRIWRNDCTHPWMYDFRSEDAQSVLDTCERVLQLAKLEVGAKQVRKLREDPQLPPLGTQQPPENEENVLKESNRKSKELGEEPSPVKKAPQQLGNERKSTQEEPEEPTRQMELGSEKTAQPAGFADRLREHRDSEYKKTLEELKQGLQQLDSECKDSIQQLREDVRQLDSECKDSIRQLREEVQNQLIGQQRAESQPASKPVGAPVRVEVEQYRNRFREARSRNGWTYRPPREDSWSVTRWVGKGEGELRAAVYSPSRKVGSEWVDATEWPLIYHKDCKSEEEAFEYLWRKEESGEIERLAHKAIEEYNVLFSMPDSVPGDSPPTSGSDDDIPF